MNKFSIRRLKTIKKTTLASFCAGAAGAVLGMIITPWLYILVAAALYVPPVLRLSGILKDVDEFELEAMKKGSVVSNIITGCFLFAYLIFSVLNEDPDDFSGIMYFLIILQAFSYFMARYYFYWMNRKAGRIIIGIELLFWGAFVIMSAESVASVLMEVAVIIVSPVIVIILSFYKPGISGIICMAFSVFSMFFFGVLDNIFVFFLLSVPLLLAGAAIFRDAGSEIRSAEENG